MSGEPVTASPQQFIDLIVANPVVLLIVKKWRGQCDLVDPEGLISD
jgi:hypothetical protein